MNTFERLKQRAAELGLTLPDLDETAMNDVLRELQDRWSSMPASEQEQAQLEIRSASAKSEFNELGFLDFYWCMWRREAPPYAAAWVKAFMSEWTILYCFRGSTKSTTLTITLALFWLLHRPYSSVLIVQANDTMASLTTALIADVIEFYEGWKKCAPHLVPDIKKGWGAHGYFIMDTTMEYHRWLEKCQRDHLKDPSFVGSGITGGDVVGMHPTLLLFDDIHDRKNSAYPKDRQAIVDTVRANVIPTITRAANASEHKPFIGVACTFWDEQDAYHALLETGLFKFIKTPIMSFDENGPEEFEGKKVRLTWPEQFPLETIQMLRNINSSREFARMYLCDLETQGTSQFSTWIEIKSEDVDWKAPMVCGADPVNAYKASKGREGDRSHFAMSYGVLTPTGATVLADGVLVHCTPYEAEQYIMRAQMAYVGYQTTVIETYGGGAVFISFLQRNPDLRILPADQLLKTRGNKATRQYELLEPLLRSGKLQLSDAKTPFLNAFRNYLDRYPNLDEHAPEWDVADAVFYMCLGRPDMAVLSSNTIHRHKKQSPWISV